jgi:dihydrofolate synthase/folylpolyglutamate synthase
MMHSANLDEWLVYLENLHLKDIDLGLARVARVRDAMALNPAFPVITVGGTNGKGSVSAMLSTMLRCAGFRVGTYTSPHILRYNERIAIDMEPVPDADITTTFAAIEAARGEVSLSYFEFGTLAAMHVFARQGVDVAVLEVGLGGRLDAVNIFDPDVAVVVSVDLDHQSYLGDTREAIGYEKAGIFRAGRPALCADPNPPQSLLDHAAAIGADLRLIGRDFRHQRMDNQWAFRMPGFDRHALPLPALRGDYQLDNASAALAALAVLHERLPVGLGAIKRGLAEVDWPGRFQVLPGRPLVVLDVGHNPHAVRALVRSMRSLPYAERSVAVFSMLADKDVDAVIELAREAFDAWYVGGLDLPRGQTAHALGARLAAHDVGEVHLRPTVAEAWKDALSQASENDRIVVFGSFHTVAEVMLARQSHR